MSRLWSFVWLLGLLPALAAAPVPEGAPPIPVGTWRVNLAGLDAFHTYLVLKIETPEPGVIKATVLDTLPGLRDKVKGTAATLQGKVLKVVIHTTLGDWTLETVLGERRLLGTFQEGQQIQPVVLTPSDKTILTLADNHLLYPLKAHTDIRIFYEHHFSTYWYLLREPDLARNAPMIKVLQQIEKDATAQLPKLLDAIHQDDAFSPFLIHGSLFHLRLLGLRGFDSEAFKKCLESVEQAATPYGPAMLRTARLQAVTTLLNVRGAEPLALEQARLLDKDLDPRDPAAAQVAVLKTLQAALTKTGQQAEARALQNRIDKLEDVLDRAYVPYIPPLEPVPFRGRLGQSKRVVVLELLTETTNATSLPLQAAFDALEKTYKPADVVLIQYQVNSSALVANPLATPEAQKRWNYYARLVYHNQATVAPLVHCNGKERLQTAEPLGDPVGLAKTKYDHCRRVVNPLLEQDEEATVTATATRKGNLIRIQAEVKDLKNPGPNKKLRLLLVEDVVRYQGLSSARFHRQVFRTSPGGIEGFPLPDKEARFTATMNLDELRRRLREYVDDYSQYLASSSVERPLSLKNLRVIALVQDDTTAEILQAVQVDVPAEGAEK